MVRKAVEAQHSNRRQQPACEHLSHKARRWVHAGGGTNSDEQVCILHSPLSIVEHLRVQIFSEPVKRGRGITVMIDKQLQLQHHDKYDRGICRMACAANASGVPLY